VEQRASGESIIADDFAKFRNGYNAPDDGQNRERVGHFSLTAACDPEPKLKTFNHFAEGGLPGTLELPIGRRRTG
jgi:hypothetical protein